MALTRGFLKDLGIDAEVIDKIMEKHGQAMSQMMTRTESEESAKLAVAQARKEWESSIPKPVKATETEEYKDLLGKYNGMIIDDKLRKYKVKDKFTEFVKSKVDMSKFDESIVEIKGNFSEFFEEETPKEEAPAESGKKPQFASDAPKGDAPTEEDKIRELFSKAFS